MPDDSTPKRDTIPAPPPEPDAIPAGKALLHVSGAFIDLLTAVDRAQAICHAIARALDATAAPERSAP